MSEAPVMVNGTESNVTDAKGDSVSDPPKTAKQLEKEAKKQAKLEKLKQKQEKLASIEPKEKSQVSGLYLMDS